jgi:lysophospholipase L1-like esterase
MKIVAPLTLNIVPGPLLAVPIGPEEFPAPAPSPTPTPAPAPDEPLPSVPPGGPITAHVTSAPANGATISGVVTITIAGENIQNAELLPEFGYSPIYGTFKLAADRSSASLSFNTASLSDRTTRFRVSAFNTPPNTSGATEVVVFTREWTLSNGSGSGTSPLSIIADYYGDSTVVGHNGGTGDSPVSYPVPQQLAAAYPGMLVRNEGVSSTDSTQLLAGNDGVHPPWTEQMAQSNATHVFCNHAINDWISENQFKTNLTSLINEARQAGKTFVLVTPNPTKLSLAGSLNGDASDAAIDDRAQYIRDVANSLNVALIDVHAHVLAYFVTSGETRSTFTPDGIHPTQSGYDVISDFVIQRFGEIANLIVDPAPAPAPSPSPGTYPQMSGPIATDFTSVPTFFDDFNGSSLSTNWAEGLWYDRGIKGQMRVINGELQLTGRTETLFPGKDNTGYAVVTTDPNGGASPGFQQRYGVFEIECQMAAGRGYWPAFWLFGHSGTNRPEIDVFEAYPGGVFDWSIGNNPPRPGRTDATIHAAVDDHLGWRTVHPSRGGTISNGVDLSSGFRKYTLEWDQTFMRFYVNGELRLTINDNAILEWFRQWPLYIILQLGLNYGTAGGPSTDPSVTPRGFGSDPASPGLGVMRIKYCAAWQYKKYS